MESRAKLLGHPIHPMLIVFPLGLLVSAVVFDSLYMREASATFAVVGYWNIAGGVLGGLLAAVFGIVDWLAIPSGTRAKRIGLLHGACNIVVVTLFALVWVTRTDSAMHAPRPLMYMMEIGALLLAAVGGWLGAELVDRLGVGVDDGAHLNARSSLSGRPARE